LERLKTKAEVILRWAEKCRAMESEEEKVIPFYESSLNQQEKTVLEEVLTSDANKEFEDDLKVNTILDRFKPLENFWKRFNHVQLERIALLKEQDFLKNENQQLRLYLKEYVNGLSISDQAIMQSKALLSAFKINPKPMDTNECQSLKHKYVIR
ncbi:Dynein regulatory complex subunit 2, partial [Cichlidogyrus casuarinus]